MTSGQTMFWRAAKLHKIIMQYNIDSADTI